MKKTITILCLAGMLAACRGHGGLNRKSEKYDVVEEGTTSGVSSTINGPGEPPPVNPTPITGTGAVTDTTGSFTLPAQQPGMPPQPGSLAGTLPPPQAGGQMGTMPPSSPQTTAPRPLPRPTQPVHRPAPRPTPPPPTQTQPPPTDTSTTTSAPTQTDTSTPTSPPTSTSTDAQPQKKPPEKPPTSTQPPPDEPPPPPPPTTGDTLGQ